MSFWIGVFRRGLSHRKVNLGKLQKRDFKAGGTWLRIPRTLERLERATGRVTPSHPKTAVRITLMPVRITNLCVRSKDRGVRIRIPGVRITNTPVRVTRTTSPPMRTTSPLKRTHPRSKRLSSEEEAHTPADAPRSCRREAQTLFQGPALEPRAPEGFPIAPQDPKTPRSANWRLFTASAMFRASHGEGRGPDDPMSCPSR